jgi:hypothetical protein
MDLPPPPRKPQLPVTGPYTAKDQRKSDRATKFIGQGSIKSSTNKYRIAWGDKANCGKYTESDIVFISSEGARSGRLPPNLTEIKKATDAKATLITDIPADRQRPYNMGERQVEAFLKTQNYFEASPGTWKPTPPKE